MSAPILMLRSKGIQDELLCLDPEITFWKAQYKRHTNFVWEDIEVQQTAGQNTYGQEVQFVCPRSGDLVSQMMVAVNVDEIRAAVDGATLTEEQKKLVDEANGEFLRKVFCSDLGRALIERVELTIGGFTIEEMTGDILHILERMFNAPEQSLVDTCPSAHGGMTKIDEAALQSATGTSIPGLPLQQNRGATNQTIYIPLMFTCNTANGLALPMVALSFHDTRIKVKLRQLSDVSCFTRYNPSGFQLKPDIDQGAGAEPLKCTGGAVEVRLLCRYIFVEEDEREDLSLEEHHYLITETQEQRLAIEPNQDRQTQQLYFSHPVKELLHYFIPNANRDPNTSRCVTDFWNFTMDGHDGTALMGSTDRPEACSRMNLLLNTQRVYQNGREAVMFSWLFPQQFHTRALDGKERVYVMPFCIDPQSWMPTGSVNFSRIDTVQLALEFDKGTKPLPLGQWVVVARNFNWMKVKSGLGGKRFAS